MEKISSKVRCIAQKSSTWGMWTFEGREKPLLLLVWLCGRTLFFFSCCPITRGRNKSTGPNYLWFPRDREKVIIMKGMAKTNTCGELGSGEGNECSGQGVFSSCIGILHFVTRQAWREKNDVKFEMWLWHSWSTLSSSSSLLTSHRLFPS